MTLILAIDPGSELSAWVVYDVASGVLRSHAKEPNEQLLTRLREAGHQEHVDRVVIEWTAPRGMPASAQLFETLWWAGRFAEAARPLSVDRIPRLEVKQHICGRTNATDTNIRHALIDRYGGVGGKAVAIGLKASPGPLYGVSKDVWAALAVACTWADREADR